MNTFNVRKQSFGVLFPIEKRGYYCYFFFFYKQLRSLRKQKRETMRERNSKINPLPAAAVYIISVRMRNEKKINLAETKPKYMYTKIKYTYKNNRVYINDVNR